MFDEETDDNKKRKTYSAVDHLYCIYESYQDRCPLPASCVLRHGQRTIRDIGRKVVASGYCIYHWDAWHLLSDRKYADQLLHLFLSGKIPGDKNWIEADYQKALKDNPVVSMMAKYPPRSLADKRSALAMLNKQYRNAVSSKRA